MPVEKRGKGKTNLQAIKEEGLCLGSRQTKVEDNNNNNKDHLGLEGDKRGNWNQGSQEPGKRAKGSD